ncbi:antigen identified by monoclonal antibody Ki-67 [Cichlidogyrus casuarinus]|uniref:Antigen identified by monoclonal antibody Ki-67 n=1 Tax=Cichlidogyrus casuarinus TaxID=1844966 RepID=A0ABD2QE83_9PLAT
MRSLSSSPVLSGIKSLFTSAKKEQALSSPSGTEKRKMIIIRTSSSNRFSGIKRLLATPPLSPIKFFSVSPPKALISPVLSIISNRSTRIRKKKDLGDDFVSPLKNPAVKDKAKKMDIKTTKNSQKEVNEERESLPKTVPKRGRKKAASPAKTAPTRGRKRAASPAISEVKSVESVPTNGKRSVTVTTSPEPLSHKPVSTRRKKAIVSPSVSGLKSVESASTRGRRKAASPVESSETGENQVAPTKSRKRKASPAVSEAKSVKSAPTKGRKRAVSPEKLTENENKKVASTRGKKRAVSPTKDTKSAPTRTRARAASPKSPNVEAVAKRGRNKAPPVLEKVSRSPTPTRTRVKRKAVSDESTSPAKREKKSIVSPKKTRSGNRRAT